MSDNNYPSYEVESILNKKIENGLVYYLIKWKHFPKDQSTWEPIENLDNCKETLLIYEEKFNKKIVNINNLRSKRHQVNINKSIEYKNGKLIKYRYLKEDKVEFEKLIKNNPILSLYSLKVINKQKYFSVNLKDVITQPIVISDLLKELNPMLIIEYFNEKVFQLNK